MPWRNPKTVPFTRIEIAAHVPSGSGVYGILCEQRCLFVGESWNLKARLLDLANSLSGINELEIIYETCSDEERGARKTTLCAELAPEQHTRDTTSQNLPGLSFWGQI